MNIQDKYNEICGVFEVLKETMNGTLIKVPQVYQAVLHVENCAFAIVACISSDYRAYIEEIVVSSPIAIDDRWRLKGSKSQSFKSHLGDEIEDYEVYYGNENSKEIIAQLFKDQSFIQIMDEMKYHSFYVQDGQIYMNINPSHDIEPEFFTKKMKLLQSAKAIIESYM